MITHTLHLSLNQCTDKKLTVAPYRSIRENLLVVLQKTVVELQKGCSDSDVSSVTSLYLSVTDTSVAGCMLKTVFKLPV